MGQGDAAVEAALAVLGGMLPDLARALGPDHEVVLHDLRLIPNSIVAIGGDLTGRSVGGPTTDLLLRLVYQGRHERSALRYQTRSASGRILRSSTLFIRDHDGRPVGCLCINTDITEWLKVHALVDRVTRVVPLETGDACEPGDETGVLAGWTDGDSGDDRSTTTRGTKPEQASEEAESFAPTVDELAVSLAHKAIDNVGVPVALMQKPHKLQVVRELEASGLFLLRDAVDLTANMLSISRYSVYKYLKELQVDPGREIGFPGSERRSERRRLRSQAPAAPTNEGS